MASTNPHFRVLGIPIRIEPVFWVVSVFLAFNLSDARLIIVWVAVVLVSVLVHELGHALALKAYGQPSSIVLHGFGGVTLSRRRLGRMQSIVVSLAGPLTAMALLGLPAYLLRESTYGQDLWSGYRGGFGLWPVIFFAVYVNIWWSVANLLPIRPLDGGNVMTELIGIERARILSVAFGAAAAVWAYTHSDAFRYAAFFAAFLAFVNFSEYRRAKTSGPAPSAFDIDGPDPGARPPERRPGPRPTTDRRAGRPTRPPSAQKPGAVSHLSGVVEPAAAESMAWNLLRDGDAAGAKRALQRSAGPVPGFVRPTVEVALGAPGATDELVAAYLREPSGPSNLVPATVAAEHGQAVPLARALTAAGPEGQAAASGLQTHLHYAERFDHAAAVGEVVYATATGTRAQVAFDTACSWSRAGDADRGLQWIQRAVADGFGSVRLLDGEPDLEPVRRHPEWTALRASLT